MTEAPDELMPVPLFSMAAELMIDAPVPAPMPAPVLRQATQLVSLQSNEVWIPRLAPDCTVQLVSTQLLLVRSPKSLHPLIRRSWKSELVAMLASTPRTQFRSEPLRIVTLTTLTVFMAIPL